MASCYVLDHVIQECLHEKAKVLNTSRGKNTEAKVDIYAQSWIAVNAWIESRLAKQKVTNQPTNQLSLFSIPLSTPLYLCNTLVTY